MLVGLLVGLALVMFVAKVLFMMLLFAIPFMLLYYAFQGMRYSMLRQESAYHHGGFRQHLDPRQRQYRHEDLVPDQYRQFDWMMDSRTIYVQ